MMPPLQPRAVWRLIRPYWTSNDRWNGLVLLVVLVVIAFGMTAFEAWLTEFTRKFYDAIDKRDFDAFKGLVLLMIVVYGGWSFIFTVNQYFTQFLDIRWRRGLTAHLIARWFADNAFYRLERRQTADNPDQRIAEDARLFVNSTLTLGLSFLTNLSTLAVFGYLLWSLAGPMDLGGGLAVPGYLFWVAIIYGIFNSGIVHLTGKRLSGLAVEQQRVEADFRFTLVQQREGSEQIAMYRGMKVEQVRLRDHFDAIWLNWREIMTHTKRMTFASRMISALQSFVPLIAVSPKLFAGEINLGGMLQIQLAFGTMAASVAWFARSYVELFQWSAVTRRLVGLLASIEEAEECGIVVKPADGQTLSWSALVLALPSGAQLTRVSGQSIEPGQRWLVRGPSGVGKSTFLRAIAGIWPHGSGVIEVPSISRILFLPQKTYLPLGSLKQAIAYPRAEECYEDVECLRVLALCRLEHLIDELHSTSRWAHRLSLGEQQRLALARALLVKPDILIMDEATSAVDTPTEADLFAMLRRELPGVTWISVAHHETLAKYHDHELTLTESGSSTRSTAHEPLGKGSVSPTLSEIR